MTKRDAICEAALDLFAEKGIEGTTIREIAQRAGAAEGTLYRHFKGKDELADWLYGQCAGQLQTRLLTATAGAAGPEETLEALIRGVFDFFDDRPTSCTYLLSHSVGNDAGREAPATEGRSPVAFFAETIEEGINGGVFRDESVMLLAGWILALVQRTVLFLKGGTLDMSETAAVDQTVDAALQLVAASPG